MRLLVCEEVPDPSWFPNTEIPERALGFRVQGYGMRQHRDLFTARQLLALSTFTASIAEARIEALACAQRAGFRDDQVPLATAGAGASAYTPTSRQADSGWIRAGWPKNAAAPGGLRESAPRAAKGHDGLGRAMLHQLNHTGVALAIG